MDCSPPGSLVHGILQARILDGLPYPSPRDLSDPWIEPVSPESSASQVDSLMLGHRETQKMGRKRQFSYEKFQVIYVDAPPSRKWSIIPHYVWSTYSQ